MDNKLTIQAVMDEYYEKYGKGLFKSYGVGTTVSCGEEVKQFFKEKLEEILKGLRMSEENSKARRFSLC